MDAKAFPKSCSISSWQRQIKANTYLKRSGFTLSPLFRFERTEGEVLSRLPPAVDTLHASDVRWRSLVRPSLGRNVSSEVMLGVADMRDLGMDALLIVCSRNTNVVMVWAWML